MFEKENKLTQDEYKVGDFFYYNKPSNLYQVKEINSKTIFIKGFGKEVRHVTDRDYYKDIFYGGKKASDVWHKAKLEEIPIEYLSNEEILEVAKQYYPIGTKFKSPISNQIFTVKNNHQLGMTIFVDTIEKNKYESHNGCLFDFKKKKWAEIISTSEENKDDFILPEKWCIKITKENKSLVQKYNVCNKSIGYDYTVGAYYGNKMGGSWVTEGAKEITTEQFKKYVLGLKVEDTYTVPTKVINEKTEELKNFNEIYIPKITKQKKKIDYTINSVFADIKVNLPEKPKKIVKPIVLEKFNLII